MEEAIHVPAMLFHGAAIMDWSFLHQKSFTIKSVKALRLATL